MILKINKLTPCAFFPRTFCEHILKLSQKSAEILFQYPLSLKINTPFLITQHGGSGACGGMAEKFPPLPPFRHMSFSYIPRMRVFLEKSFRRAHWGDKKIGNLHIFFTTNIKKSNVYLPLWQSCWLWHGDCKNSITK